MGEFSPGWSNSIQADIQKYYNPAKYNFLRDFPFGESFRFKEITYDPLFVAYLAEAKKQADQLAKWSKLAMTLPQGTLGVLQGVVTAAIKAPADNFLVNYLGDVAFYIASDISELVKNAIVDQFSKGLGTDFDPANDDWSIVGHSLGTRVLTEFLQSGFTAAPSLRAFGKARVVMQVANVSRLLEDLSLTNAGDVYSNAVYPSLTSANGCCTHFINATHRLDPFAFVDEFDPPPTFGDGRAFLDNVFHPVKLAVSDITDKNVHALAHYMLHPAVHTTLFQYLIPGTGRRGPTAAEMKSAMDDYRGKTLTADITNVWRDSLVNLKSQPFQTVQQIFALWEQYGQLL
jgi:hypothetical protein